ncbi:DUF397 domain-containing protein [Actinoplanes sp. NBC_00393]|uniref:DUF397 domain-containing protein n=1 Tax=Actinoplanes sp. NBC_00393 TaxID=2975953 RepID=UPI002E1A80B6
MADERHSSGWKKSSYSETGNCVEVLQLSDQVLVRDSKDPAGGIVAFSPTEWLTFLDDVKGGKFDL